VDGERLSRIVIAGGSGFIGKAISKNLKSAGHEVIVLGRSAEGKAKWDSKTLGPWAELVDGSLAVINLTGETVAQKWTYQAQEKILNSRVDSTKVIGEAIQKAKNPPKAWVNASAIGFYGNHPSQIFTEGSPSVQDGEFLVETCKQWESAMTECSTPNTAQSRIRIGVVLGQGGGALPVLAKLTRAFLGGAAGNGQQWMSWIHIDDLAQIFVDAALAPLEGIYNATAPNPETNADLMATMRKVLGRPWSPNAPGFAMKLAGAFGAPEPDLVLQGNRVIPARLTSQGFQFKFPELEPALRDLLKS
jgi:uncharacterized protein (TIGR01777 family)